MLQPFSDKFKWHQVQDLITLPIQGQCVGRFYEEYFSPRFMTCSNKSIIYKQVLCVIFLRLS